MDGWIDWLIGCLTHWNLWHLTTRLQKLEADEAWTTRNCSPNSSSALTTMPWRRRWAYVNLPPTDPFKPEWASGPAAPELMERLYRSEAHSLSSISSGLSGDRSCSRPACFAVARLFWNCSHLFARLNGPVGASVTKSNLLRVSSSGRIL